MGKFSLHIEHFQKNQVGGLDRHNLSEYLRSAEMTEEQNYNMIDGRLNNISGKKQAKQKERTSVLEKLHRKQKEIAIRSGKQPEQAMGADMERNRK